jgi:hypothetical protein
MSGPIGFDAFAAVLGNRRGSSGQCRGHGDAPVDEGDVLVRSVSLTTTLTEPGFSGSVATVGPQVQAAAEAAGFSVQPISESHGSPRGALYAVELGGDTLGVLVGAEVARGGVWHFYFLADVQRLVR